MTETEGAPTTGRESVAAVVALAAVLLAADPGTRVAALIAGALLVPLLVGGPRPRLFGRAIGADLGLAAGLLLVVLAGQGVFVLLTGSEVVLAAARPDLPLVLWTALEAFAEELFFRGFLQALLARRLRAGPGAARGLADPAVLLSALVFAAAHATRLGPGPALLRFFPGLLFAWSFRRSGALAAPFALHLALNLIDAFLRIR